MCKSVRKKDTSKGDTSGKEGCPGDNLSWGQFVLGTICPVINLSWGQFVLGQFVLGTISPWTICPGDNLS